MCGERSYYTEFVCDICPTYCKDQLPLSYGETGEVSSHILGSYILHFARISSVECILCVDKDEDVNATIFIIP